MKLIRPKSTSKFYYRIREHYKGPPNKPVLFKYIDLGNLTHEETQIM